MAKKAPDTDTPTEETAAPVNEIEADGVLRAVSDALTDQALALAGLAANLEEAHLPGLAAPRIIARIRKQANALVTIAGDALRVR